MYSKFAEQANHNRIKILDSVKKYRLTIITFADFAIRGNTAAFCFGVIQSVLFIHLTSWPPAVGAGREDPFLAQAISGKSQFVSGEMMRPGCVRNASCIHYSRLRPVVASVSSQTSRISDPSVLTLPREGSRRHSVADLLIQTVAQDIAGHAGLPWALQVASLADL